MGDGVQPQLVTSLRVYIDLNGNVFPSPRDPDKEAVALDGLGTLCWLADAGMMLEDGLLLTIWMDSSEDEDLEADVVVFYCDEKKSWVGEVIGDFRDVPALKVKSPPLVCVSCRFDFKKLIARHELDRSTTCPECGVPAWQPILPPTLPTAGQKPGLLRTLYNRIARVRCGKP